MSAQQNQVILWGRPIEEHLGVRDVYHTFLTFSDDLQKSWGCFGDSYYGGNDRDFATFSIYTDWAAAYVAMDTEVGGHMQGQRFYEGGLYDTVTGTCQTIGNRLLALSEQENTSISELADDQISVVVFGKYGAGIAYGIELISAAAVAAGIPEETKNKVIARLLSPEEVELKAWCDVLGKTLGVDLNAWLASNPDKKAAALAQIQTWMQKREEIFARFFSPPLTPGQLPDNIVLLYRIEIAGAAIERLGEIGRLLDVSDDVIWTLVSKIVAYLGAPMPNP